MLDEVDRRLVAALQLNGRAGWSHLAAAIGVSERTVTRRISPLLSSGVVRVVAVHNPASVPDLIPLVLRLRCKPGSTPTVAKALAALPECLEVLLLEGGEEIFAIMFVRGTRRRDTLLLEELPATRSVLSWRTHRLLRVFPESLGWRADLLEPHEVARIEPALILSSANPTTHQDEVDLRLIDLLATDGRLPYAELAKRALVSESTARRKVANLIGAGVIRISTEVDAELLGYRMEAVLWLSVRPSGLGRVGSRLAGLPCTRLVAVTSGSTNLVMSVICRDMAELYGVLTETFGELPEVNTADSTPVMRVTKRGGTSFRSR